MTQPPLDLLARVALRYLDPMRSTASSVLASTERLAPDALERAQFTRASTLLANARATVPHYASLPPVPAVYSPSQWRALPILTRETVRDVPGSLVSRNLPAGHVRARETRSSGSTGRHVVVQVDAVTDAVNMAISLRDHAWHRRDLTLPAAAIRANRTDSDPATARWSPHPRGGSLASLDMFTPVREQLAWLVEHDPAYLATYASNALALVTAAAELGVSLPSLREVQTLGEALPDSLRDACARTWHVPVVDTYSCIEFGFLALQCPASDAYHVPSESVLLEVLRDDGEWCTPGETGRVVVTGLHGFVMPLVRYDLGDYATVGEPCECGRGLPTLARIDGRVRNMMVLASGDRVWPRFGSDRLGAIGPIRQFRMVQRAVDAVELQLVVARPLTSDETRAVRELVLGTLGLPVQLALVTMDSIPRSAGGKYEDFVCEVEAVRTRS